MGAIRVPTSGLEVLSGRLLSVPRSTKPAIHLALDFPLGILGSSWTPCFGQMDVWFFCACLAANAATMSFARSSFDGQASVRARQEYRHRPS